MGKPVGVRPSGDRDQAMKTGCQTSLYSFFPRPAVIFVPGINPFILDPMQFLCCTELMRFRTLSRGARGQVRQLWQNWDKALTGVDHSFLEQELTQVWKKHQREILAGAGMPRLRAASQMYACWPSRHWFKEPALPVTEHVFLEYGDSSYNVWIFDVQQTIPILGKIVCDLYLRHTWPPRGFTTSEAKLLNQWSFLQRAAAALNSDEDVQTEKWEFQMQPLHKLMKQIWWDSAILHDTKNCHLAEMLDRRPYLRTGDLCPRRPKPCHGFSLLAGQESVFMMWDRCEVWFYGCYVD